MVANLNVCTTGREGDVISPDAAGLTSRLTSPADMGLVVDPYGNRTAVRAHAFGRTASTLEEEGLVVRSVTSKVYGQLLLRKPIEEENGRKESKKEVLMPVGGRVLHALYGHGTIVAHHRRHEEDLAYQVCYSIFTQSLTSRINISSS